MQHSISNSLILVTFIFLARVFSSVTIKRFLTFSGIIFDVMLFVQSIIIHFLLTQSNCVVLNLNIFAYSFLLILIFLREYTNFQST